VYCHITAMTFEQVNRQHVLASGTSR